MILAERMELTTYLTDSVKRRPSDALRDGELKKHSGLLPVPEYKETEETCTRDPAFSSQDPSTSRRRARIVRCTAYPTQTVSRPTLPTAHVLLAFS